MKARKLRILVLMHEDLVPPEHVDSMSESDFALIKTEFDVLTGLRDLGHEAQPLGLSDDLNPLRQVLGEFKPHIAFNLIEEFRGEAMLDQNVVSFLELVGVPYTGCNPRGLMIARDKALSKKILHYHRIRVPRFAVFPRGRRFRLPSQLQYPLIVKSQLEEASVGISEASVVYSDDKLAERVAFVHQQVGTHAIAEQYIDGREMYVGVLGERRLTVLPVWELKLTRLRADAPRIATTSVKWDLEFQKRRRITMGPARNLSDPLLQQLENITKRLYRILQLSGYARIDFRVDDNDKPFFLEANPNPDIAYGEEFAEAAAAAGIEYEALLQRIVNLGLRRAGKRA